MPYIIPENRETLDPYITSLATVLKTLTPTERSGDLNYVITKLMLEIFPKAKYSEIAEAGGMLESCKQEWYRRRMGPREDQASHDNGDVYPNNLDN